MATTTAGLRRRRNCASFRRSACVPPKKRSGILKLCSLRCPLNGQWTLRRSIPWSNWKAVRWCRCGCAACEKTSRHPASHLGDPKNVEDNPMSQDQSNHLARINDTPRCGARTRSGTTCRRQAMPNGKCRIHGGLLGRNILSETNLPATSRARRRSPPVRIRIKGIQSNIASFGSPSASEVVWRSSSRRRWAQRRTPSLTCPAPARLKQRSTARLRTSRRLERRTKWKPPWRYKAPARTWSSW